MTKSKKVVLIALICILSLLIILFVYNRVRVQSIFDEIYYDSRGASGDTFVRRSSLGDIKGMNSSAVDLTGIGASASDNAIMESYKKESLKYPLIALNITNNSGQKILDIASTYSVNDNLNLFFTNKYSVKERTLTKSIDSIELDSGKRYTTPEEMDYILKKYNITQQQLEIWDHEALNDVFLTDWVSVYPSRFSADKMGKVTIKKEW